METIAQIELINENYLEECLNIIRSHGKEKLFEHFDIEQFILGVREIGMNAIRHAEGGELELSANASGGILRVVISDSGKGIANLNDAKKDGFSTIDNSLGIGLNVAERSCDRFRMDSVLGEGTSVLLEKHRPISHQNVDYGIVSLADQHYQFNGDQFIIKEYNGDSVLVGVIDGPGQGYDAHAIASTCKEYVERNIFEPIDHLLEYLDALLTESNDNIGITASLARLSPGKLVYKGFGDTHAYLMSNYTIDRLANQGGRLGQLMKYRSGVVQRAFDDRITLVLCTDGISTLDSVLDFDPYQNMQGLANRLFDQYHKPYGDATILAVKYNCK